MKFVLLAAAAVIATPAIAQTMPAPTPDQSATMPTDPAMPAQQTMSTDQSMPSQQTMPSGQTMPSQQTMTTDQATQAQPPMAGSPMGTETAGGYQPSMPAVQGTMTPGMTPVFRAAPSPSEAFPPPAPQASYPICKKGEFDNCMQGPKSTHSREVRGRR